MSLQNVAADARVPIECIEITAEFEGCLKKIGRDLYAPYLCPARVPTIGFGTTVYNQIGKKVSMTDQPINRERCEELLAYDIGKVYLPGVLQGTRNWQTSNQLSACVSFAYNVGHYGFRKSTLCFLIKSGQHRRAAEEFPKWKKAGPRVLNGLVRRRASERALFLRPGPAYAPLPAGKMPVPEAPRPPAVDAKPVAIKQRSWFRRWFS